MDKISRASPANEFDIDAEDVFEVERITHAERVGTRYMIYIKWKGYEGITTRWRHELVAETSNAEILAEIEQAVAAARSRYRATRGGDSEDELGDDPHVEPEPILKELEAPTGNVSGRLRPRKEPLTSALFSLNTEEWVGCLAPLIRKFKNKVDANFFFLSGY
jgi:hypothetical protein